VWAAQGSAAGAATVSGDGDTAAEGSSSNVVGSATVDGRSGAVVGSVGGAVGTTVCAGFGAVVLPATGAASGTAAATGVTDEAALDLPPLAIELVGSNAIAAEILNSSALATEEAP
jgi:hypothetical protein